MAQAINGKAQQKHATARSTDRRAEAFVSKSEKHDIDAAAQTRALDTKARAIARRQGIKSTIYTIRGSQQQKRLVAYAAEQEGVSVQKIYGEIFEILEERYGEKVPLDF